MQRVVRQLGAPFAASQGCGHVRSGQRRPPAAHPPTRRRRCRRRLLPRRRRTFPASSKYLLAPTLRLLASLYATYNGARHFFYRQGVLRSLGLPCPVISIGNLTVGGTGKTPFVEYLSRHYALSHRMPTMILQVGAAAAHSAVGAWETGTCCCCCSSSSCSCGRVLLPMPCLTLLPMPLLLLLHRRCGCCTVVPPSPHGCCYPPACLPCTPARRQHGGRNSAAAFLQCFP